MDFREYLYIWFETCAPMACQTFDLSTEISQQLLDGLEQKYSMYKDFSGPLVGFYRVL